MATGKAAPEDFCEVNSLMNRGSGFGLAWACRREILSEHGLYDACILGGGDRVMACGAIGEFGWAAAAQTMNARRYEHYLQWARPFFESVSGKVEYIEGRVFHLWHGDLQLRRYAERRSYLETFDPFTDIAPDGSGCWRWSSDKPDMHRLVREYFRSRSEDGDKETK
jgi:hypothetical protein